MHLQRHQEARWIENKGDALNKCKNSIRHPLKFLYFIVYNVKVEFTCHIIIYKVV